MKNTCLYLKGILFSFSIMGLMTTCTARENFFTLAEEDGHWWFISPWGQPFFSLGLNHIDPASLRYPENIHIWEEKYHGSTIEWLETAEGREELSQMAEQYYKTIFNAIRKYDPNHLILGDRYEANAPIAMEVIEAALPYVDVLSFQDFRDPAQHLNEWYKKIGKPVLLADGSGITKGEGIYKRTDGAWYANQVEALYENPGCVGFHLCGAYQRNKARARGLLDEHEHPDIENVEIIQHTNEKINARMKERFATLIEQ